MIALVRRLLPVVAAAALATAVAPPAPVRAAPSLAQLVGQKLMVAMSGTAPDAAILDRARRGEIGGVILFGANITDGAGVRAISASLQAAAADGGQPPLLIATDQEGGGVRRIPWAGPTASARQMGADDTARAVTAEGRAAGAVLRCAGIQNDLAPVADVPASTSSFMYQQARTWSFSASTTSTLANAFAAGLDAAGSLAAMKHFPGIGLATQNTDTHVVTITASKSTLAPGLQPYSAAIANGIPMIMLSNATYTAYDGTNAAGWSPAIAHTLLRTTMGFDGVSITDSLTGTAAARGVSATSLAIKAAKAGTDMLLLTGSESSTAATYSSLVAAAQAGTIPLATLQASYDRILALKATLHGPVADSSAPTTSAPVSRLYAPATLGSTTVPVRTTWSASDPCGVSRYQLTRRIDGSAWASQPVSPGTATSIAQWLPPRHAIRYAVKAEDGAGNVGAWTYGATVEPVLRESSTGVSFSGPWSSASSTSYSGGSTRLTTTRGASATYAFTGTSVAWVSAAGPTRGSAKVYVDGAYVSTVNLHASSVTLKRVVFARSWTSQGAHTIRIVAVGDAGHPRVDVDAFAVLVRP